ncbi:MAG: Fe-S oxidoreductase [Gammaproteobacteria bacterium]|nr:Fe-S oxidoreductase [Gammaproteobacteria bacterium]
MTSETTRREGSLEAPTRHALKWQDPEFYNEDNLFKELERVFDICHGCRRCFSLCHAFPTLFDAIDESPTLEVDGVPRPVYWEVVDHCFLCDMCYMSKCPYVPPHEWNVDFPHLMLRAKANKFKKEGASKRDRLLASTDTVGRLAGIPVIAQTVNAVNRSKAGRKVLEKTLGVATDAPLPPYSPKAFRSSASTMLDAEISVQATARTTGKVALFATCYGNRNQPDLGSDLLSIFQHNGIAVTLADKEKCCGMPRLELGDLESVAKNKEVNVPALAKLVDEGYDIVAPIPSCVLMFKQELPLMFPDDPQVQKVQRAIFDPFEYLLLRHKDGKLNTDFKTSLGKVAYHAACHVRVQNIGLKTRDMLNLVPDTSVEVIERCSGHDGTYGVKKRFRDASVKICRPVARRVESAAADYYASDCPMAGQQIGSVLADNSEPTHPLKLIRMAYGI